MAGTLSELRTFFATRIAATSTSGLGQGSITSPTWKQERSPFALLDEPKARTHLAFSCQISDAIFTDAGDGSSTSSRYVVEASVAVLFRSLRLIQERKGGALLLPGGSRDRSLP